LWNFIGVNFSMINQVKVRTYKNEPIDFLLEDSEIKESIKPYIMARIVDVENFLSLYPFKGSCGPFHFVVDDPLLEWNRGIFSIEFKENGEHIVGKTPLWPRIKLSINTLTTALMSYKRPRYLKKIGKIEGDNYAMQYLEKIIPSETAYFSDYF